MKFSTTRPMATYSRLCYTPRKVLDTSATVDPLQSLINIASLCQTAETVTSEGGHCIFDQIHRVICWPSGVADICMGTYNRIETYGLPAQYIVYITLTKLEHPITQNILSTSYPFLVKIGFLCCNINKVFIRMQNVTSWSDTNFIGMYLDVLVL